VNKELNNRYFQNFEDWKINYQKAKNGKNNDKVFQGSKVEFEELNNEEKLLAKRLNLFFNFDFHLLRKKYLNLIKENHPDKYSNNRKLFKSKNEFCKEINEAYEYFKEKYFSK
jgi:hypothetical protein